MPSTDESLGVFPVDGQPFGLHVRTPVTARPRTFIEMQSGPAQRPDQIFRRPFHKTGPIRILDPQQKCPLVLSGEEVIIEGGA
jgi:hypothetical protein